MKCPHCDTPIDEHEASLCLNAWVAEAVMGWLDVKMGRDDYGGQPIPEDRNAIGELLIWAPVHAYSTDIAAAWEVVGRMRANELTLELENECAADCVHVAFRTAVELDAEKERVHSNRGEAPLAICRAALKAVAHD